MGSRCCFLSTRGTGMPVPKMYTMPVTGEGLPTELPFPMAGGGASFSPDGSKIAYMPLGPCVHAVEKVSRRADHEDMDRET
jgi:Tol biopolymer transport system component